MTKFQKWFKKHEKACYRDDNIANYIDAEPYKLGWNNACKSILKSIQHKDKCFEGELE